MKASEEPIIIEETFPGSLKSVWKAITLHSEMIKWFFADIPDFKAEVGFSTEFLVTNEGRNFTHQWKVVEVIPEQKISYTWRYKEYPGDSVLTMEIMEDKDGVHFILTDIVTEDFPEEIPEFKRENGIRGWTYFIKDQLKQYLSSKA